MSSIFTIQAGLGSQRSLSLIRKLRVDPSGNRMLTNASLNSQAEQHDGLPSSFYNDRKGIYLKTSQALSRSKLSYMSKPLSRSERKKVDTTQTEMIISKRLKSKSDNVQSSQSSTLLDPEKRLIKQRYQSLSAMKYSKLAYGSKDISTKKKLLSESIRESREEKQNYQQWRSPFLSHNSKQSRFEGKPLVPAPIIPLLRHSSSTNLKVLNFDRLYRRRDGVLTNVMPLPIMRLSSVTARSNVVKVLKAKDCLQEVINEYNGLLTIMKDERIVPRLGVRGKRFTKGPTIEELMGIKMKPKKKIASPDSEFISEQIFSEHCGFYREGIKDDVHLRRRLICGLKRKAKELTLEVFIGFYLIFVNKVASEAQKIDFLAYFFVPSGQDKIEYSVLQLILEIMCRELPPLQKLNFRTDSLSGEEKSKIFLEALLKVLFGEIHPNTQINRQMLQIVFQNNPEAVDLLIKLLQTV